ncbi:hypothetical protein M885DRAFT_615784 [Pelagophyceae sp. CCMP2097]|nr:hypothetical protein M885DRAFT_615784 [Pelagophyceae sp. CCMP2097]
MPASLREVAAAPIRPPAALGPIRVWLDATKLGGAAKVLVHDVSPATRGELMWALEEHAPVVRRDRHRMPWIVEYHDPDFNEWFELDETLRGLRGLNRPWARLRVAFVPRTRAYSREEAARKIQRWLRFIKRKQEKLTAASALATLETALERDVRRAIDLCQGLHFEPARGAIANQPCFNQQARELEFPAYVAVVVKQIRNLSEITQTIDMAFTLVLRIDFGEKTPSRLRNHLVERLQLRINETPHTLDPATTDCKWKGSMFFATTRMRLDSTSFINSTRSEDYSIWSPFPFDQPVLHFAFELTSTTIAAEPSEEEDSPVSCLRGWKARYNVHQYLGRPDENAHLHATLLRNRTHMSFKPSADAMPNFDVLHSGVRVDFPVERKKEKDGTARLHYPSISFKIPLFRHPGSIIRLMVFPLLVLNTGTLLTMFMNDYAENYNDRIMTLVTLILSLFAFLSYVRNTLPDVPVMTWMDKIIFKSTIMNLSVMLESLFAFVTETPGRTRGNRGGAFAYFWLHRATARSLVRCFGVGSIVIGLQVSIITGLLVKWYRYNVLRTDNNRVIEECKTDAKKSSTDFKRSLYGLGNPAKSPTKRLRDTSLGRSAHGWFNNQEDSQLFPADCGTPTQSFRVFSRLRSAFAKTANAPKTHRRTQETKIDCEASEE